MRPRRPPVSQDGADVLLSVEVRPRSARNDVLVVGDLGGIPGALSITIRVTPPPVEGAANAACQAVLADILNLPKSRIAILSGKTARHKLIRIQDADAAIVLARLQSAE